MTPRILWIAALIGVGAGCSTTREQPPPNPPPQVSHPGPPAHAPAHGWRRKHQYCYYPTQVVYYEPARKLYFWIAGDGWKVGAELPSSFALDAEEMVMIDTDAEKPYTEHGQNKAKYPPGQVKKKKNKP